MKTTLLGCGIAALLIVLITAAGLYFYIAGNPISASQARRTMEQYLAETYPDKRFTIREVHYDIKFNRYQADVVEGDDNRFILAASPERVQYDQYRYTYAIDAERTAQFSDQFRGELEAIISPISGQVTGIDVDLYVGKEQYLEAKGFLPGMEQESDIEIFLVGGPTGTQTFTAQCTQMRDAILAAGYRPRSLRFLYNLPEDVPGKTGPLLYVLKINQEEYEASIGELLNGVEEPNRGKVP